MIPCRACNKGMYPLERMQLNANVYHKTGCAKCATCNTNLTPQNFAQMGDVMLCKAHYMQAFSRSGGSYNNPVASNIPVSAAAPAASTVRAVQEACAGLASPTRALPPVPQSMIDRQQQHQSRPVSRLSAFLNQHSSASPAAVASPVRVPPPQPQRKQQQPPPQPQQQAVVASSPAVAGPSRLSAFLGKNTTASSSLKDICMAPSASSSSSSPQKQQQPPLRSLQLSRQSMASSNSSTTPAVVRTTATAPLMSRQDQQQSATAPIGNSSGLSLKERLRMYTSAANTSVNTSTASSSSSSASSRSITTAPLAQRLQNYRQATANSSASSSSSAAAHAAAVIRQQRHNNNVNVEASSSSAHVPTAIVVDDDTDAENSRPPASNNNVPSSSSSSYHSMLLVCQQAKHSLDVLPRQQNIKQQQAHAELCRDMDAWIARLDRLAAAS